MDSRAFLLNPQQFSEPISATEAFLSDLGILAALDGIKVADLKKIHDELSPAQRPAWLSSVARELLLKSAWSEPEADLWALFVDVLPFDDGSKFSAYGGQRWAAAMFPLDLPNGAEPAVGQIWATKVGADIPELALEGVSEMRRLFPDVRFRLILPPPARVVGMPTGRSWQLAAALAAHALSADPIHTSTLAAHWIATGRIVRTNDGTIQAAAVSLGNKLNLLPSLGQRRWCMAADQLIATPTEVKDAANLHRGKFWPIPDLMTAWRTVIRQGTVSDLEETTWPVGVAEMHTFVSPALGPCLASILHFQPQRLIIWHSREMESNGTLKVLLSGLERFRVALGQNLPPPKVYRLTATSLIEAETRLGEHTSLVSYSNSPVYFNLTNGNLLQRLAAYTLAQRNPDIWMIYREGSPRLNDGQLDLRFDLLRFRGGQPTSGKLRHGSLTSGTVTLNWEGLMNTIPLKKTPPSERVIESDLVNELLKRAGLPSA